MERDHTLRLVSSESISGLESQEELMRARAHHEVQTLGLSTRAEVIAYFHDFHGWPMEYINQEAAEVDMDHEEVLGSLAVGRLMLLESQPRILLKLYLLKKEFITNRGIKKSSRRSPFS